jgi:hypothetical protein
MNRSGIYTALRDLVSQRMNYVKFIDLEKGQMSKLKQNYPIPLPSLFIEFGDCLFSDLAEGNQKGNMTVSIYLYTDMVCDSFTGKEREAERLAETVSILDRYDDLYETFASFSIEGITPLVRRREYRPQYGNRYIMLRADFVTTIDDAQDIERNSAEKPQPNFNFNRHA